MSDVQISPNELLRIIGELEVTRRVQADEIDRLQRQIAALSPPSDNPALREKQERP